jgi:hypothetical protein
MTALALNGMASWEGGDWNIEPKVIIDSSAPLVLNAPVSCKYHIMGSAGPDLHKKSAIDWQAASNADELATYADEWADLVAGGETYRTRCQV